MNKISLGPSVAATAYESQIKKQWQSFADMMEPISCECLCIDPPHGSHEESSKRDYNNPSCHSQYCPHYLYAYARALANGDETPE